MLLQINGGVIAALVNLKFSSMCAPRRVPDVEEMWTVEAGGGGWVKTRCKEGFLQNFC